MKNTNKKIPKKWQEFEREVAELLLLQGHEIQADRTVGGRQTDLVAINRHSACATRILVECKYHEKNKSVGVVEVTDFCSRVNNSRVAGKIDKGFLITNTKFTRQGIDCAREHDNYVLLLTKNNLENSLIDFSPYARRLVDDFENMELSQYMVDLSCTSLEGKSFPSLSSFVIRWLNKKDTNQMCILGDYGTGKTSFCFYLSAYLAKEYLSSPERSRIPIFIRLRDYIKAGDAKAMVTNWLVNQCGVPNGKYSLFRRMLENGRFVLILDGFDEMTMRANLQVIYDNFRNLSELYYERGKLIITGRPGYFPDLEEMNRIILGIEKWDKQSPYEKVERHYWHAQPYCVMSLESLTSTKIDYIVQARKPLFHKHSVSPNVFIRILWKKYDLSDLAKRPVLLDILIRTYCQMGAQFSAANTARLYELYTNLWIQRDRAKGKFRCLVSPPYKRYFMEEIAWKIYKEGETKLHYREIPHIVRQFITLPDEWGFQMDLSDSSQTDYFSHDIMTCSFLGRSDEGYYRFYHTSFMEYFVAAKLFRQLKDASVDHSMGVCYLSGEVAQFLAELVVSDISKIQERLYDIIDEARIGKEMDNVKLEGIGHSIVLGASNAMVVLSRIAGGLEKLNLDRVHLDGAHLSTKAVMSQASFNESFLNDLYLVECNLSDCKVENAIWQSIDCTRIDGSRAKFKNTVMANTSFRFACLEDARFIGVKFKSCDFKGANLKNTTFEKCQGTGMSFVNCEFKGARLSASEFNDANFEEAELGNAIFKKVDLREAYFKDTKKEQAVFVECKLPTSKEGKIDLE